MSAFAAIHPAADVRCFSWQEAALHDPHAGNRQPPHFAPFQHGSPWSEQQRWWEGHCARRELHRSPPKSLVICMKDETARLAPCVYCSLCCRSFRLCTDAPTAVGGVSVNVPQFFVPPADSMSQVSVMDPRSAGAPGSASDPCETRRTVSLPKMSSESLLAPSRCYSILLYINLEPVYYFFTSSLQKASVQI